MSIIPKFSNFYWNSKFNTSLVQRIRGAHLIRELMDNFKDGIDGKTSGRRVWMYSSPDSIIIILLQLLKVHNKRFILYGSVLFFELHRKPESDSHFVRIYFLNETMPEKSPHLLRLPKCDSPSDCPIDRFIALLEELIPKDLNKECGISDNKKFELMVFIFMIVIVSVSIIKRHINMTKLYLHNHRIFVKTKANII